MSEEKKKSTKQELSVEYSRLAVTAGDLHLHVEMNKAKLNEVTHKMFEVMQKIRLLDEVSKPEISEVKITRDEAQDAAS